ncbi:MAG: hypothetical protein EXS49_00355 [Candidatus Pacebacteria bacterium]|nr:hypothetical protein [Candidatus Paceibacterota bacterium]
MKRILKISAVLFSLIIIYPSILLAEEIKPVSVGEIKPIREGDFKTLKAFKASEGSVKSLGAPEMKKGEIGNDARELRGDKKEIRSDIKDIRGATNLGDRKDAVRGDVRKFRGDRKSMMEDIQERMKLGDKDRMERMRGEREEFENRMEAKKEEFKNKFEERKSNLEGKLKAEFGDKAKEKSENISKSVDNALANFTKHIEKLNEISSRIEAELNSLSASGKDVTALSASLVDAKVNVVAAETALTEFQSAYQAMTLATDPKLAFPAFKDAGEKVADAIRTAHKGLVDIIPQIRALNGEPTETSNQPVETQNTNQ